MIQFDTEHEGMIVSDSSSKSSRMIASLISMVCVWPLATAMVIPLSLSISFRVGFVQVYKIEQEQINPATKANF